MILGIGCPRSGTGYLSQLLQAQGYDVGHEIKRRGGIVDWRLGYQDRGRPRWTNAYSVVIHVVRNPIKAIASMLTMGDDPTWNLIREHIALPSHVFARNATMWLEWNRHCEWADVRVRVEDLPRDWYRIAAAASPPLDDHITDRAFGVPTDYNTRPHPDVEWDQIPQPWRDHVREMAAGYGYQDC